MLRTPLRSTSRPFAARPFAVLALAVLALAASLSGCSKFDEALGQQWIVVTFASNTTVASAKRVVSICAHVPNLPLEGKVQADTGDPGIVDQVQFNAVKASDTEMAQLESCLNRFPNIVVGFQEMDQGD